MHISKKSLVNLVHGMDRVHGALMAKRTTMTLRICSYKWYRQVVLSRPKSNAKSLPTATVSEH